MCGAGEGSPGQAQPAALLQELLTELDGKQELAEAQERMANIELALQVLTAEVKNKE